MALPGPSVIPSADASESASVKYDFIIIGAGILGSALSTSLAKSGRKVLLVERDLTEPDRIVGELLQPGGCIALRKLGIDDCLDGIDSVAVEGYKVFWGKDEVAIPYPAESVAMSWSSANDQGKSDGKLQEGRSFHHGRFVQSLRKKAQSTPNVTLVEATVSELIEETLPRKRIVGVKAKPRKQAVVESTETLSYCGSITIIADGCFSKFRRDLLPSHVAPLVRSNFVGLVLEDADLPAPHHGHVILKKNDSEPGSLESKDADEEAPCGPVLVYQLAEHETRMLVDIPGSKAPSSASLPAYLEKHVTPVLPPSIVPSFEAAIKKARSGDSAHRFRSMPNSYLAPYPQGRVIEGAFLAGDSLNMRHPLTGGGMTVAMNDTVLLTKALGGSQPVGSLDRENVTVCDLDNWSVVAERLEDWHWERKGVASCINTLAQALYSLFGADDENLEVLKTGCFKYFELGGDRVGGPVSLLSALTPSPLLLIYHFFSVAFYSIYILFITPQQPTNPKTGRKVVGHGKGSKPSFAQYPKLTIKSVKVFWSACFVLLPVLWNEAQM